MSIVDPLRRKHKKFDLRGALNEADKASPAGAILGQMVESLLFGRLEYATVWDDLKFPATSINPPGAASDPDWDVTKGGWLFDSGATEVLFLIAQMPHAWKEGSTLKPHIHWEKTTSAAGTVLWELHYEWSSIGKIREAVVSISNDVPAISDADTADLHALTPLPDMDATGKTLSNILLMRVDRNGGSDTYGADARLLEFDLHYEMDSLGSDGEYTKVDEL